MTIILQLEDQFEVLDLVSGFLYLSGDPFKRKRDNAPAMTSKNFVAWAMIVCWRFESGIHNEL